MAQLEPLNLKLTGSADGLTAALGKAEGKVSAFGGAIGGISSRFSGMVAAINPVTAAIATSMAAITAGASAAALAISKIGAQFTPIDELADAANRLGVSFNELKGLRLAIGEATGLRGEQVDAAIAKLQLNLAEAAGSQAGTVFDRLKQLGLDAGELIAEGPIGAIEAIASKVQELKNPTDQLRVAFDLFGKSGVGVVNALREGPDAIRETVQWAEKALGLTDQQVEAVGRMNDRWDRVNALIDTFWQVLASEAAPVIESILITIGSWVESLGGAQKVARGLVDTFVDLAATYADMAGVFVGDFNFDAPERYAAALEKIRNAAPTKSKLPFSESDLAALEADTERMDKIAKDWKSKADKWREQLQTPAEKLQAGLMELQGAVDKGGLDWQSYARGVQAVTDEFMKAKEATSPTAPLKAVTDRTEQIRVVADREQAKRDEEWQAKLLTATQLQVEKTKELIDAVKKNGVEPPPLDLD